MNIWKTSGKTVTPLQNVARITLGLFLFTAGVSHLSFARKDFQAQVPDWVPLSKDLTVILSGIVEIMFGLSLAFWIRRRVFWGWIAAVFFVLVFPGNVAQLANHRDAFGLDTDLARTIRLFFQPVLIGWVLWSTGAWAARRLKSK